ncbi:excinuclease ABC subunit UvrA [Candidatus Saccharibacteria bacterium]|nr:excinuclease ABC subunit UvrA [Candidatus Saccharibacteria bacterium]
MSPHISIRGAREHNLKNVSVDIPREKLVVITGVSGSGKSSLAFDTIFAEGQRRYLESLSSYARQFLGMKEKPVVERIDGLSPVISIDQKSTSRNPRSTVATVTEIYDYLRLLYARVGIAHDPAGLPIKTMSFEEITKGVLELPKGHRYLILASVVEAKKGQHAHIPDIYRRQGYSRARVNGIIYDLDEFPSLDKNKKHTIEIVVDRVVNNEESAERIRQSIEAGLSAAENFLLAVDVDEDDKVYRFSQKYYNPDYPDFIPPDMEPRTFSFNSPFGACGVCTGLGRRLEVDPDLVIPNGNLTLNEGAIRPYNRLHTHAWTMKKVAAMAERFGFSMRVITGELRDEDMDKVLYGTGDEEYEVELSNGRSFTTTYEGVIPNLERLYRETDSEYRRREIERYMVERPCHSCGGKRLKEDVLRVTVGGHSIATVTDLTVVEAKEFLNGLKLEAAELTIAEPILREIAARLGFLEEVGLEYLTLNRSANTLSGGEAQRIRLATQIGSGLQGVLYILDEPSIGLHPRDHQRLLSTLKKLRDLGNSLLVVEHDEDTIRQADFIVDVGPGAGVLGGEVTAVGTPAEIEADPGSLTGRYLSGEKSIDAPAKRRSPNGKRLKIIGATQHNLKDINVEIPLGVLVGVSGVSGSGKSTLINSILASELQMRLNRASNLSVGRHKSIEGVDNLDKVIIIDQDPIGRTPRSNPATYVGLYTAIRTLFADTPLAKQRGYNPGRFSFNVAGGRCETCAGDGALKKEMHFLPDIFITCEACNGKRYMAEVLEVHYKGKNIADILGMSVAEALEFFANIPSIHAKLLTLSRVGLGYITLGQSATTLSGGEAQRVKLAKELSRRATGRTLYVLDEPTTGLHMDDIGQLLEVLHALVDAGNSMIIIEHNLDVLKNADWLIDMGPKGGAGGGEVVAAGRPEDVAKAGSSYTGQFLAQVLRPAAKKKQAVKA